MSKMRICITRNAEARTNAAIARIVNALMSTENEICLLTRTRYNNNKARVIKSKYSIDGKRIPNYEIQLKAKMGRGLKNIFNLLHFQIIVFKWFLKNSDKYDVIHAFDLDTGLPIFIASKLKKKKYVYHIADFYADSRQGIPKILKKLVRRMEYLVIANAETTIICTEERKHQIQGSHPKNLVVVHNTPSRKDEKQLVDNGLFESNNESKRSITFAYVGSLSENRFIRSVIDIFKCYPEFKLELAGMGKLSDYADKASEKYDNIIYHGMVNYSDALVIYSRCDIMFAIYNPKVPNYRYSAPNKVYEAMTYGKPIIVAKGTSVDKLVENEKMGFSIDYTKQDFERVLSEISTDPSILVGMGINAKNAYPKYSWEEMKKRIISIYEEIQL